MVRKVIVIDGYDKHFVLFAKGHYGAIDDNFDERMRVMVGYFTAVDEKKIPMSTVYYLVSKTFVNLCITQPPTFASSFLAGIFSYSDHPTITRSCIVRQMLGALATLRFFDDEENVILEIGKPDPKLKQLLDW